MIVVMKILVPMCNVSLGESCQFDHFLLSAGDVASHQTKALLRLKPRDFFFPHEICDRFCLF